MHKSAQVLELVVRKYDQASSSWRNHPINLKLSLLGCLGVRQKGKSNLDLVAVLSHSINAGDANGSNDYPCRKERGTTR